MLNRKLNLSARDHFSIRKLTVGVASVLIGITFFGFGSSRVQAAENPVNDQSATTQVVKTKTDQTKEVNQDSQTNQEAQQALIPGKNNTSQPNKVNGQGDNALITNVPANGSIEYDYSISATNKNTGQTQTVNTGAAMHNNRAILVTNNAKDIQAHLELKNISKQDQFIGNSEGGTNTNPNKFNNDEAALFINAWAGGQCNLKIDSSKSANVVFTKGGKVVNDNALPVYYLAQNGTWYTYQDMLKNFGATSIPQVTQIGFKGIIPGETTATMNVPLTVDIDQKYFTGNQIDVKAVNDQSIYVNTYTEPEKLWSIDEVKNEPLHLVTRRQDGSYDLVDDSTFAKLLPRAGQVLKIIYSGNLLDTSNQTIYQNGYYIIDLPKIQTVLRKFGYSVNPFNTDLTKLMPLYTYAASSNSLKNVIIRELDGKTRIKGSHVYFYVEVHQIINTKDSEFQEGSKEAQTWNYDDNVTAVYNVEDPRSDHVTGYIYKDNLSDQKKVGLVNIKDASGQLVKTIDGQTPAGTYYVTVSYKMNDSNEPAMLIEKTFVVTVTPKPVEPNKPAQNTPLPTPTPSQPTDTNPVAPTTPSVRPLPEDNDNKPSESKENRTKVIAPKAQEITKRTSKTVINGKKVSVKTNAINNKVENNSVKTVSAYKASPAVKAQNVKVSNNTKTSLPQTGEKDSNLTWLGLSLMGIALIGLAILRKKNI